MYNSYDSTELLHDSTTVLLDSVLFDTVFFDPVLFDSILFEPVEVLTSFRQFLFVQLQVTITKMHNLLKCTQMLHFIGEEFRYSPY